MDRISAPYLVSVVRWDIGHNGAALRCGLRAQMVKLFGVEKVKQ